MQFEVYPRSRVIMAAVLVASSLLFSGSAFADSCGVLPFSSGRAVNQGAADNITALVSSEVDIRGGFGLVLTATADDLPKGCASKSSCIIDFGKEEGYERVVSGKVEGLGSAKYRITTTLWNVSAGRAIREVEHEMERSADVLVMAIPDLVVELLTGAIPQGEEEDSSDAVGSFAEADFDDEDEETGDDTKWMDRDRHGRKVRAEGAGDDALSGLDDLDDLDLDDMTEESIQKKPSKQDERREREAKRRAEEERLEELAKEEQSRRNEQRRRADAEAREREKRREAEREEARRESERAEAKRAERQRREARRQEEQEEARERERRREEEQRQAYSDPRADDSFEDYELEDEEEVIEIESTISLGGGLVMVEDDETDDYFGSDEEDQEPQPGDIVEYRDGDYSRRARPPVEDRSLDNRRRDDDRLTYNAQDDSRDDVLDDPSDELDTADIDLDSDGGATNRKDGNTVNFNRASSGVASRSGAVATVSKKNRSSRKNGPFISIKAGAGWAAYYPETLSLGMFDYGFEASFFPLPWLSVDVGANFWSVSLVEYDDDGNDLRTVRTLPSFLFGATWHGTFHKVLRPYVGIDIGALLYAQALVEEDGGTQIRPLFAPLVAADLGMDFIIIPNFGLYVGGKLGVAYAARVQETVNSSWNPTTGLAEIWAGALVQF